MHTFCKCLFLQVRKELKIKHKNIATIKWNSNNWYVYIDPIGEVGCYRGCCRYDALIQGMRQFAEWQKEDKKGG